MTYEQFRGDQDSRDKLRKVLDGNIFRAALGIIVQRRRVLERGLEVANLGADSLQSLRLFNQRIGMDSLIFDLYELCEPILPPPQDPEPTWDPQNAHSHLNELDQQP